MLSCATALDPAPDASTTRTLEVATDSSAADALPAPALRFHALATVKYSEYRRR